MRDRILGKLQVQLGRPATAPGSEEIAPFVDISHDETWRAVSLFRRHRVDYSIHYVHSSITDGTTEWSIDRVIFRSATALQIQQLLDTLDGDETLYRSDEFGA